MSSTHSNVDGSQNPLGAVTGQEQIDAWPQIQAYKQRTYELFEGLAPVLDVGCGPGGDVVAMGDRTVGVDPSEAMCMATKRKGGTVTRGNGLNLPFAEEAFGGVRADRVIQHVADPAAAVREMRRVCRVGGRFVVVDPDQETLTIQVSGVTQALTDKVKRWRRDNGYRNGRTVTMLPHFFRELGLVDVTVDAFPLVLTDPTEAFGLPRWPRLWGFSADEVEEWERNIDGANIIYALLYFVVSGRKQPGADK